MESCMLFETAASADYYAAHRYPEKDNADIICLQGGEEVSEADFSEVRDHYAADANEVTCEKYGRSASAAPGEPERIIWFLFFTRVSPVCREPPSFYR